MNLYLALLFAILFEVTGTMLLPLTKEFSKLIPTSLVIIFYSLSFYLLSVAVLKITIINCLCIMGRTWCLFCSNIELSFL